MPAQTIDQLVADIERTYRAAKQRRTEALDSAQGVLFSAMAAGRDNLTAEEEKRFQNFRKQGREATEEVDRITDTLTEAKRVALEQDENQRLAAITVPTGARRSYDSVARIGAEERTTGQTTTAPAGRAFTGTSHSVRCSRIRQLGSVSPGMHVRSRSTVLVVRSNVRSAAARFPVLCRRAM